MSRTSKPPEIFKDEAAGHERPIVEGVELAEVAPEIEHAPVATQCPAFGEGSPDLRESCEPWPPASPMLSSLVRRLERRLGCDGAATESIYAVLAGIRSAAKTSVVGSPETHAKKPQSARGEGGRLKEKTQ